MARGQKAWLTIEPHCEEPIKRFQPADVNRSIKQKDSVVEYGGPPQFPLKSTAPAAKLDGVVFRRK
jgi:hypothetical protein